MPWELRDAKAVWRGQLNFHPAGHPAGAVPELNQIRVVLVDQGIRHPELIDAVCGPRQLEHLAFLNRRYCRNNSAISMREQADRFRFALSVDGFGAAFRTFKVLSSGVTPMLPQDSQFVEHFYGRLIPWYEYVPTSTWALAAAVRFLREHDALARHIALNALRFAKRNLLLQPTLCYILLIWRRIAAL